LLINIVKGLHILAVIAWMAGLLYLPRLFAYHTRADPGSQLDTTFRTMERKLLSIIMTPAMAVVLALGASLVWLEGVAILREPWMIVKLGGVLLLVAWHLFLQRAQRAFAQGRPTGSERFWRMTNEIPFLIAIVIVLSVTTKYGR